MKIKREWGTFGHSTASLVKDSIEFAGKLWQPNRKLAYIKAELCHSMPLFNSKRRGFTAQTLANSYKSIVNQLIDFEHRLKFYGGATDKICGAIAAVEYPELSEALKQSEKNIPVPMSILFALWRKADGVEEALEEMAGELNPWKTSMECEYAFDGCALWDGEKAVDWKDAPPEMKACVKQDTVEDFASKPLYLLMGGINGEVLFTGGALTKWPSDKTAKVVQVAASEDVGPERKEKTLVVNAGWKSKEDWQEAASHYTEDTAAKSWDTEDAPDSLFAYVPPEAKGKDGKKSLRKFPLASVERKGLDPAILRNALARLPQAKLSPAEKAAAKKKILAAISKWNSANPKEKIEVSEKAALIIGSTMPCDEDEEDEHIHEITADLQVLEAAGHSHYVRATAFDPESGTLELLTSTTYKFAGEGAEPVGHKHKCSLGKCGVKKEKAKEEGPMFEKLIAFLKAQSEALKETDEASSKQALELATELSKQVKDESVEEVIAARIKNGDLVPKAKFEEAVKAAETSASDKVRKELEEKAAIEKRHVETIANRMKLVADAKLDPKFALGKERTIESVVASIPTTDEGDKLFEERLGEWTALRVTTSQATASEQKPKTVPLGGGEGTENKKPGFAFI